VRFTTAHLRLIVAAGEIDLPVAATATGAYGLSPRARRVGPAN